MEEIYCKNSERQGRIAELLRRRNYREVAQVVSIDGFLPPGTARLLPGEYRTYLDLDGRAAQAVKFGMIPHDFIQFERVEGDRHDYRKGEDGGPLDR